MSNTEEFILIVDDDQTFAEVLANAFASRGFNTHTASNSESALKKIAEHDFDKIVLDLKIDQESGLNLLPQLKEHAPNTNIIILTGYSSIATTVQAIKLGASNYLCKPANADEILTAFDTDPTSETPLPAEQAPSVNRLQWEYIQKTLDAHNGNISATARSLGMHRRTLQRKLQKRPVKK